VSQVKRTPTESDANIGRRQFIKSILAAGLLGGSAVLLFEGDRNVRSSIEKFGEQYDEAQRQELQNGNILGDAKALKSELREIRDKEGSPAPQGFLGAIEVCSGIISAIGGAILVISLRQTENTQTTIPSDIEKYSKLTPHGHNARKIRM